MAIAMPSSPNHSPATAMTPHNTAVTAGHGENTASTGAKKNPVPMYHADPARSEARTKRSQRGTGDAPCSPRFIVVPISRRAGKTLRR